MKTRYTNEKNILMLISLLKQHNIKKVIASPGTTNLTFVSSIQTDDFFEIYSCVDERSACYMACGLAAESGEPVVLTCTGATASRNYIPGLTEAYYRKLPILAVTATQHLGKIGHNIEQVIDRTSQLNDMVNISVQVPTIHSDEDAWAANVNINKALLELKRRAGGPAHINIVTTYSREYQDELPCFRAINRYEEKDKLPLIKYDKIGIFIGAHKYFSNQLTESIDKFCEKYNAVVFCDSTSNYNGKYKILPNLICDQEKYLFDGNNLDLLINIGDVSGSAMRLKSKETWRVNPDGELRDTYKNLKNIFEMDEYRFFEHYNCLSNKKDTSFYKIWYDEYKRLYSKITDDILPFSNLWVAKNTINKLPEKTTIYLGILNSLRSWNYFNSDKDLYGFSNTGGFGIDGVMSSLIGASLNDRKKTIYGVIGDLSFFYDMNVLGNHNISNNVRLILINNGCGTEFHNYDHPGYLLGDEANKFVAANGHFGNKSNILVKNYVESLGFEYICASSKEEFLKYIDKFTSNKVNDKPIIFEIFTDSSDESNALKNIRNIEKSLKGEIKDVAKKILPTDFKSKMKKVLNK